MSPTYTTYLYMAYQETQLFEDASTAEDQQQLTVTKLTQSLIREQRGSFPTEL